MSNRKVHNKRSPTSFGPNDVILGRGNHLGKAGNEKFLEIVRTRSMEYWFCIKNTDKDAIARQVVDTIKSLGGGFLRNNADNNHIIDSSKKSAPNISNSAVVKWEIASTHTILTKVKQTFRDLKASAKKRTASSRANKDQADLSWLLIDQYSDETKLSKALSPATLTRHSK